MKTFPGLALAALMLAACNQTAGTGAGPEAPSGGSAGTMGDAYCEQAPSNPDEMTQWNQLCFPNGPRR